MRALTVFLAACCACGGNAAGDLAATTAGSGASSGAVSGSSTGRATSGSASASASTGKTTSSSGASGASSTTASSTGGATTSASSGSTGSTNYRDPNVADLPVLSNPGNNGVLNPISLVTVTFINYPYTAQVEALGDYLAASNYIAQVTAEYGVTGPTTNINIETGQSAPANTNDSSIASWITSNYAPAGKLPPPDAGFTPIYLLYYPSGTSVTNTAGGTSCQNFDGYHLYDLSNLFGNPPYYYAVINDCDGGASAVEATGSHEVAEAATDPNDANLLGGQSWTDHDNSSPWVESNAITEVADVCEGQTLTVDAGAHLLTLSQVWSENAALDGGAPCVPVDPERPFYAVLPDQLNKTAAAGGSATYTLTGWSSGPLAAWPFYPAAFQPYLNGFTPNVVSLGAANLANGQTTTLVLGVPSGTASGAVGGVQLVSALPDGTYSVLPLLLTAQ